MSPRRCPSRARYATPGSKRDASIRLTQVRAGTPRRLGATLVQVRPPLRVTWMLPSSVPAHTRPGTSGDSAIVKMVAWVSALVTSRVRPPLSGLTSAVSAVERSGLTMVQVSPRSVLRKRWLPPNHTTRESWGDRMIGELQLNRKCERGGSEAAAGTGRGRGRAGRLRQVFREVEHVGPVGRDVHAHLAEHRVEPPDPPALGLGVDRPPVVRIHRGMEAVARVELEPVVVEDAVE